MTDPNAICNHGKYKSMCTVCKEITYIAEIAELKAQLACHEKQRNKPRSQTETLSTDRIQIGALDI